jgi:D-alanyl-D-alanine carboxypeptidase
LSWLTPSLGTVDALAPINAAPPNMREEMCGKRRKRPAAESVDEEEEPSADVDSGSQHAMLLNLRPANGKPSQLLQPPSPVLNPVVVYVGPAKRPDELAALAAAAAKAAAAPPVKKKPAAKKTAATQAAPKSTPIAKPTPIAAPAPIIAPEKKAKSAPAAAAAPTPIIAPEKKAKSAPAAAPKTAAVPTKQAKQAKPKQAEPAKQ